MIVAFAFILGVIVIGLIEEYVMDYELSRILSILFLLFYSVGATIYIAKLNFQYCDVLKTERIDLYSGFNDNKMSGSYFLIAGSISENDTVYYWINEDGLKTKHEVPMRDSSFIEDGGEYLLKHRLTCRDNLIWLFLIPLNDPPYRYEFHVPEGSILNMYNYK